MMLKNSLSHLFTKVLVPIFPSVDMLGIVLGLEIKLSGLFDKTDQQGTIDSK